MSEIIRRIQRFCGRHGILPTIARVGAEVRSYFGVRRACREQIQFGRVDDLLDFSLGARGLFIRPSQIREEIAPVLRRVQAQTPAVRTVLEIGTNNGGTLFLWTRVVAEDAEIISLDLPGGEFGGGYPAWKRPLYASFARSRQRIHLLQDDSHRAESLARVRTLLGTRPLDLLMIDGDHTYAGVKQDYTMYGPLVRPGGLIVFHDIAEHGDPACEVRKFWLEVRTSGPAQEYIATPPQGWAGIGVLEQR